MGQFAKTSRRRSGVILALAAVVLLLAACQPQPPAAEAGGCVGPAAPPDATSLGIFNRVNSDRAANGLAPVSWNPQLWCLSQDWSNQMSASGDFHHRDLNAAIRDPVYANYATLGENILVGPSSMTADAMEDAWMNSAGHRANILSPNFDSMGIGLATSADGRTWATQNFGRYR